MRPRVTLYHRRRRAGLCSKQHGTTMRATVAGLAMMACGVAGCGATSVAVSVSAKPVVYTVLIDVPPEISREGEVQVSKYFPSLLRVHPGDTVVWRNVGFSGHYTVTFATDREAIPALYRGEDHGTLSHARVVLNNAVVWPCVDAGALVNPQLDECSGSAEMGRAVKTWNGHGYANSGIITRYFGNPLSESDVHEFALTLSRNIAPGTYRYFDETEPHMEGTLDVVAPQVSIPSPAAVSGEIGSDMKGAIQEVLEACARQVPRLRDTARYVIVAGCGTKTGSYNVFLPSKLVVPPGASVHFVNGSTEVGEYHTVTFAPVYVFIGAPLGAIPYVVPVCGTKIVEPPLHSTKCASGKTVSAELDPAAAFATVHSGGSYKSKGFVSSGFFPAPYPATPQQTYSLRFAAPGSYFFGSVLQPGMTGEVIVNKSRNTQKATPTKKE